MNKLTKRNKREVVKNHPPKIAFWILSRIVEKDLRYGAIGDFEEQFNFMVRQKNIWRARLFYWLQIAAVLPSFFTSLFYWSIAMFKNYLLTSLRNLWKQKLFSFIKISGLAIGLAEILVTPIDSSVEDGNDHIFAR